MGGHAKKYKDGYRKNHELQNHNLDKTNLRKTRFAEDEISIMKEYHMDQMVNKD
jgi:hypothetical protein